MKVKVLVTGVMCGNVMIPQGVQDTESLGLRDDDVKALMKRTKDILPYDAKAEAKANSSEDKKDEGGQPQGGSENGGQPEGGQPDANAGQAPAEDKPKEYDDVTGQEMIDFLAKKGVQHEFTKAQKKELYPVYTGHFNDPDVA